MALLMGAVAYDPKVVTIWGGFRSWFNEHGFPFDFVLYSNYERQAEDLASGRIDAAWNSPLSWIRSRRLAEANGRRLTPLVMRDTDRDLTSVVVVRADSPYKDLADLKGETIAVGAIDSPQATLLPCSFLAERGLRPGVDITVRRFDVGVGLHGDHIGGERDAARALAAGTVAAACMIDSNHLLFGREGTLAAGSTRVLAQTPRFDHCNMSVSDTVSAEVMRRFGDLLLSMSYVDPQIRPLFDLEGLTSWQSGRTSGYGALEAAVDETSFYSREGAVTAAGYQP
ncbi:ABC-type phosphate/phosphonate transport system substrate-binding protein [Nonomuraea muscovyensis]|uniref:ABC-type phosphate/phosphonate transport system substrate-binding protein n=1 Tax=Nonomuraea muscovyensis TaxID=1124761 RepID=A0A7X0CCG2_9ACTN|nr:PhnD/SsuA/transferrin family substrate-binding protein [Nonomuraea muscovyensis]MBB6351206.1 ABC-type phosphate/phosphonate transport system substrate-binding protein [Nonomuraea muscovyensis]